MFKVKIIKAVLFLFTFCLLFVFPAGASDEINFDVSDGKVQLKIDDKVLLSSPGEGLWSIATDWKNDWPCDWQHGSPAKIYKAGMWTIMEGQIKLAQGVWNLRDSYRKEGELIRCTRRFTWMGEKSLPKCTLSVRFQFPAVTRSVLLPGIIYYGNPMGEESKWVPIFKGRQGEQAIFEEHRYPMPFACGQWQQSGQWYSAALHTKPCYAPYGNLRDQWWSLGVETKIGLTELTLLSGPCASNGKKSVIKALQSGFMPYPDAYINVPAGAVIEKTFYLQVFGVDKKGSGFIKPVESSLGLFKPFNAEQFPTFADIVEAKLRLAQGRWYESKNGDGFHVADSNSVPAYDHDLLMFGWSGQSAACGYALQVFEPENSKYMSQVQKSLDTLTKTGFHKDGFYVRFHTDKNQWSDPAFVSQGGGMANFAKAIRKARGTKLDVSKWEKFLKKACDVHAARILKKDWRSKSTNEAFFIFPLCEGYKLFGEESYKQAAVKAGRVYMKRHLSMDEPYWGGTLDASCEDKEGAWAAFHGFLSLYNLTGDKEFLDAAEHALCVVLTYVYVWDVDMPAGRLDNHGFKSTGWTGVSVQNQHIDPYGVMIAPEIYQFGQIKGREDLKKLSIVMYRSCGQIMDAFGGHGEQLQQTNYAQRGKTDDIYALRGGYQERHTPFWLTAHYLNGAARFKELGVNIEK